MRSASMSISRWSVLGIVVLLLLSGALAKGNGNGGGKGNGNGKVNKGGGGKGAGKGRGGKLSGLLGGRGNILGSVQARLRGKLAVDDSGVVVGAANATGTLVLVSLSNGTITFAARLQLAKLELPSSISINRAAKGATGDVVIDLSSDATWRNVTDKLGRGGRVGPRKAGLGFGLARAEPNPYVYAFTGSWQDATALTTTDGSTYKEVFDAISATPAAYYATVETDTFIYGAARGQFAKPNRGLGIWKRAGN
ncbi:hypothetical protein CLOM_g6811 [Closterium sp. NIES-68]|nr:hypothetical protein CLOM_g6811 [Closterium sp. NIES-68]GJP72344.1 hypothetical protein CLOP_g3086 [Closterium sp. NIES-67]